LIFSVLQLADFFTAPLLFGRSQIWEAAAQSDKCNE
jgi:hypothetical protein